MSQIRKFGDFDKINEIRDPEDMEGTELNHYMFWKNLEKIKTSIDKLMKLDKNKIDKMLSDGHDWATDHIATSADDIEEVSDFFDTAKID